MMTPRQRDAIRAILDLQALRLARHPTLDDLAKALGLSNRGKAHDVVRGLERRGLISREGRGMRVTVQPIAMKVFKMQDGALVRHK